MFFRLFDQCLNVRRPFVKLQSFSCGCGLPRSAGSQDLEQKLDGFVQARGANGAKENTDKSFAARFLPGFNQELDSSRETRTPKRKCGLVSQFLLSGT